MIMHRPDDVTWGESVMELTSIDHEQVELKDRDERTVVKRVIDES